MLSSILYLVLNFRFAHFCSLFAIAVVAKKGHNSEGSFGFERKTSDAKIEEIYLEYAIMEGDDYFNLSPDAQTKGNRKSS